MLELDLLWAGYDLMKRGICEYMLVCVCGALGRMEGSAFLAHLVFISTFCGKRLTVNILFNIIHCSYIYILHKNGALLKLIYIFKLAHTYCLYINIKWLHWKYYSTRLLPYL